jgi:hypothetical protein
MTIWVRPRGSPRPKLVHSSVAEEMRDEGYQQIKDSQEERARDPNDGWNRDEKQRQNGQLGMPGRPESKASHQERRDHRQDAAPSRKVRRGNGLVLPPEDEDEEHEQRGEDVRAPEPPVFCEHPRPNPSHGCCCKRTEHGLAMQFTTRSPAIFIRRRRKGDNSYEIVFSFTMPALKGQTMKATARQEGNLLFVKLEGATEVKWKKK